MAIGLGLSLAVILAAILGLIWLAHRRVQGRVDKRIKEIRSQTTDLMDRLDALKERLKLLPATDPDFQKPMAGATASLYAAVQEAVGKLWDRWLQVMDALDRAQKLARGVTSPFQKKALHDAEATLEQKGVFEEIDAGVQAASADMDRLNQAHEEARKALEGVVGARPKLDAQVAAIRKLGLPIDPYQAEMAAIAAEADQARDLSTADPIGARASLEALRTRGEALAGRIERVSGLFQESQKASATIEGLRRHIAGHRAKGLRLDEEGGNPDESLAKADETHALAVSALRAGDPDAAAKELDAARSMAEQAQGLVEQVRVARDYCGRERPERARATERLRAALPQAESDYHRLEREFAPSSWEGASRNLDRARDLLATFDGQAADAAEAASDHSQRYLSAARLIRQLAQQQQEALRLMSGLGNQVNTLTALRDDSRRRRGELEALARRVEGYFRQNDPLVSAVVRDVFDKAGRVRDSVQAAFDQPRPDWPALRDGLDKAMEGYTVAREQAEVDVRSHQQLGDEYERARSELERVANLLAGRREDRAAANQRFRSAAEVLDQVGLDLSQPHGEWPRLLEEVRAAAGDLEQSERLAREDIRLAAQAQAELEQAARSIDQVRSAYFAMGAGADTSAAEAAFGSAEQLLGAQQYEQAIEGAVRAQRAARRAHQEAVQQAQWRQMQADAERRRWEAPRGGPGLGAAVATGAILGHILEGTAQGASPEPAMAEPSAPEPAVSEPPPESDTGVGTWESESGQGTW
jgi:septation ring formation regulator EzrA